MSEFGLPPLRPKVKVENGKRVLRCGVRDCREVICTAWGKNFVLAPGYMPSAKGVFIKTQRAASRLSYHRQAADGVLGERLAQVREATRKRIEELDRQQEQERLALGKPPPGPPADQVSGGWGPIRRFLVAPDLVEKEDAALAEHEEARKSRDHVFGYDLNGKLPALVKCATCGRLSKITEAD